MSLGLSISDVVNVDVVLTPLAAATRNFGSLLIMGSSLVIDTDERLRQYSTIDQVATDFGISAPEYLAASLFFSQSPQPSLVNIGVYAQTATAGRLQGGVLSAAEQAIGNFTAITTGAIDIMIDGVAVDETTINFSADSNLNGVAATLTTALAGKGTVTWDATYQRFVLTSATTGSASSVGFATVPGSGTDIGPLFGFDEASNGRSAPGSAIETAAAGITACANASSDWYGALIAPLTAIADSDHLAVSAFIEAASPSRIYGLTTQASSVLDGTVTSDIASQLQALKYEHTLVQYSSSSPYAVASLFGRAFTVDFTGNNTAITLKFKTEPGVTAETLSESQAQALKSKNCNVFINYNNSTAIIQEGVMCSGTFFDERQGLDWLQNAVQTNVYNLLYTSPTKIPQTDAGVNQIVAACDQAMESGVSNGLVAPGTWTAGGFGALQQGQTLSKGYYVYAPTVSSQSQADREARKAPTIQIAAKLAGAVHFANVVINVNR